MLLEQSILTLFGMFSIVSALDRSGVLKFVAIKMAMVKNVIHVIIG